MLPHLTGVYRFHVNRLALSLLSLHRPPYARIILTHLYLPQRFTLTSLQIYETGTSNLDCNTVSLQPI